MPRVLPDPTPVMASRVSPRRVSPRDDPALDTLNSFEREYVRGLRKRERVDVTRMLGQAERKRSAVPLRIQVLQSQLPATVRMSIFDELRGCANDKYVQWVRRALRLPLGVRTPTAIEDVAEAVTSAKRTLDECVTGHSEAKREVLKLVCQAKAGTQAGNYAIGLEGPPGTGKTHFARTAVAQALGRPLVCIPLGGASDASYLLGSVYTYEGSKEGRLATALVESKCCDPVIYFDEVDKIAASERGAEITAVLIHLIDPSQNTALRDKYFHGIDIDYSHCTFVFAYNDPTRVSPVLLDRIKRVPMPAPSAEDRTAIVCAHMQPRAQARLGTALELSADAVARVLRVGTCADGMRGAERALDHVLSAAQLCTLCGDDGALAGAPGIAVCDAHGVSGEFADAVLHSDMPEAAPPPPGMYS